MSPIELKNLRDVIDSHNYSYHVLDAPTISDYDFDALFKKLVDFELENPKLITPDSPTQRVGGERSASFEPVTFKTPMLSLANGFSDEDVFKFYNNICVLVDEPSVMMIAEYKFDGLAIRLRYEYGILVLGATRGNGEVGENVTKNVKTIMGVPLRLNIQNPPYVLEVNGEIIMTKESFNYLNSIQRAAGLKEYANCRNAAAGSLRQLDPTVTKSRRLAFCAYGMAEFDSIGEPPKTQAEMLAWYTELGFSVNQNYEVFNSPLAMLKFYQMTEHDRPALGFDIDGVVYKANELEVQRKLGVRTRTPVWGLAHKFKAEEKETTANSIIIQVGRTGAVTPVALLDPVKVGGVVVTNATLNNEDMIREKDIRVGDRVIVRRAGDVIPEIVRSLPEKRTIALSEYIFPTHCPFCQSPLQRPEGEAVSRCTGEWKCPAQQVAKLIHFASREAMDIDGFGDVIIEELFNLGHLRTPVDFYNLTPRMLSYLKNTKEAKIKNLMNALQISKTTTFEKFFIGLGVRYASAGTAKRLAKHFKNDIKEVFAADVAALRIIEDVGPVVAGSIRTFTNNPTNWAMIKEMLDKGVNWPVWKSSEIPAFLTGKTFVITGSFENFTRKEMEEMVEAAGGKISGSVSKKTTYVVVGTNAGSKEKDAQKLAHLGVQIVDEAQFTELLRL